MERSGPELALLLLGGFRTLTDAAHIELTARGFPGFRPVHEFAMSAIAAGATTTSELGRRLGVSKQAAAKTVAALQELGFVTVTADPHDARRKSLEVTELGLSAVRQGAQIFDELRERWISRVGRAEVEALESTLATLLSDTETDAASFAGWMAKDLGDKP